MNPNFPRVSVSSCVTTCQFCVNVILPRMFVFLFHLNAFVCCTKLQKKRVKARIHYPWFSDIVTKSYKRTFKGSLYKIENVILQNLCNEINIVPQLEHSNIIKIKNIDSDCDLETPRFAKFEMAKYPATVAKIYDDQENERLSFKFIFQFAHQMIEALKYLHTLDIPIAHGDITPNNIFVEMRDDEYHFVLGDFGYAQRIENGLVDSKMVQMTRNYAAPEIKLQIYRQLDQESLKIDMVKADIYSLGITIAALLGRTEMESDSLKLKRQEINMILTENDEHCSVLPLEKELLEMISRMTLTNPTLRPNAADLLENPIFTKFQC
eukprot:NODE_653_length_4981_cov_0.275092.p1 type:complete len:323 gc:universal NODE_653_length_4981_cov_0.275092:2299-3267(+)